MARQCPSKGKGEADHYGAHQPGRPKGGKGKGNENVGDGTAKAKGKKGGYQGSCWNCGKVGHASFECRMRKQANRVDEEYEEEPHEEEQEEEEGSSRQSGGVRVFANVETTYDKDDDQNGRQQVPAKIGT